MFPFVLPEYCPDDKAGERPLVLLRLADSICEESIAEALAQRGLCCRCRVFTLDQGRGLAMLGPQTKATDQFLRSVVYALQQVCGEEETLPDILETRLVPADFDLFHDSGGETGERDNPLRRHSLHLASMSSFGSGLHPSTRLAMALMEESGGKITAGRILDAGCGSGILSLVAARLGAREVLGVDRDTEAVAAACRNIAANGLAAVVRADSIPVADLSGVFDLVAANLAISVLQGLLNDLCRLTAANGLLVLAGFRQGQGERLRQQVEEKGLEVLSERGETGWLAFLCGRR